MVRKTRGYEDFAVGDMVEWKEFKNEPENERLRCAVVNCRNDHGDGPFIVSKIENIPLKKTRDLRRAVSHHQYVWIENITDKFSGALFQILRNKN